MQPLFSFISGYLPPFMQHSLFWVLALLCFSIYQFIRNRLRIDVIALIVIVFFGVSGLLTPQEIIAGWGNPSIVLVGLLFIISEGIIRTGLANRVSDMLFRIAGENEVRIMCLLMFSVAIMGSVMSSTGIVAIFIPVVLSICRRMDISPKRMMMPLSIAGLVSGMMTLIATAPNLVANAALVSATGENFGFFTFTPIGCVALVISIFYMLVARRWLKDDKDNLEQENLSSINQFMSDYKLNDRMKLVFIEESSELTGRSIESLNLRVDNGINIVSIERIHRLHRRLISPFANNFLHVKDILLVDVSINEESFKQFCVKYNLRVLQLKDDYFAEHSQSLGMAEVLIAPKSNAIGHKVNSLSFRTRYGLCIAGIKRDNEVISENVISTRLKAGDVVLMLGIWQQLLTMEQQEKNFFILNTPKEFRNAVPAGDKAIYASLSLATMVILMVTGLVPNVFAALIGCLMMGYFRCIDLKSAYNSIHWPLLILIVGMMPFSIAFQRSGGIDLATHFLMQSMGGVDPHILLMVIFLMTALAGMVVSMATSTILILPIAVSIAQQFGYAPAPFIMTVAIGASAAFLTPLTPVNTMILVPSGYRFMDFFKIGAPLMLLVMLASIFVIPLLLPL